METLSNPSLQGIVEEQCHLFLLNYKVNNFSKIIIIQNASTKLSIGQHEPPTNMKVGSGAAEK
jgi:hypothetical protein